MAQVQTTQDGRHDFDFLFRTSADPQPQDPRHARPGLDRVGGVRVRGRGAADPGWARQRRPLLGTGDAATGDPFEGFTLRLFDPETGLWRIWWASTRFPGELDNPVEGRLAGDRGEFMCDDVIGVGGRPVKVRYEWRVLSETANRWEQAFSEDGSATWRANWVSEGTKTT